jgi:hypothetical protein
LLYSPGVTVSLGEEQRPASAFASPPSEKRPFGRWGGPALFLAALFLATLGSRDVLLLPLVAKFLGPEGMGRVMGTATMFPNLLVLPLASSVIGCLGANHGAGSTSCSPV